MEQLPQQQYTKEFREQAVQLALEQKLTIPEAARRLTMSGKTFERWVCRAPAGPARDAGREPTARDGSGGRGVSVQTRSR
ncbi:MAG: transposase [Nitrospira sp.]|nr:transposase [Nitrospira sp.]